ncbi:hypothetical protein [uncultured Winogradskyella sp.]|uniref:hypothetical protein n=1 Tax=uncultured Winogradskyella sp. TaxID=395353 RepID=UPI0026108458|nr:hypothetical protein [uncultured Winogradskyella sp.]
MSKIIINRISEFENRARKIKLQIDGEILGEIKNGEELTFEISPGHHYIQAKIDWCTSNLIETHIEENSKIKFELRKGLGSALYRTTFGYEKYLQLIPINS